MGRPGKTGFFAKTNGGVKMNLRVLYKTPVLKLMNILVFADSFLLIFVGVGMKGDQGMIFGLIYGLLGGITAALMFDVAVMAMITMATRDKRSPAKVKKPSGH
jgi:hypothetical protein